MIVIYGLKTCDSCKKARRALGDAGHNISFVDLRANPLAPAFLTALLKEHGDEVLVNRKSTTWRGLDDADRMMPALELLTAHPKLIKRPVVKTSTATYVGWTASVQAALGV